MSGGTGCHFMWSDQRRPFKEVTFELRPEKCKGQNRVQVQKRIPGEKNSTCKGPEAGGGGSLMYSKHCKKAEVAWGGDGVRGQQGLEHGGPCWS